MQKVFLPCPFGALPDGGPVRQSAFSSQNFFLEPLEHGGHLRSGRQSSGVQNAFALALDQFHPVGPGEGFPGVGMDLSGIHKLRQVSPLRDLTSLVGGIAVKDRRQLLPHYTH